MILQAKALPYLVMEQLKRTKSAALEAHRFISVIEPQGGARIFAENSDQTRILTLFFDEVSPCMWQTERQYDEVVEQFRRRGTEFVVFDAGHADQVIDLILAAQASPAFETLFVNCSLGVARSGAIVRFVADVLSLDETKFRGLNPHIDPNEHVLHVLHKRWQERGLCAAVSKDEEAGAHCHCGRLYRPQREPAAEDQVCADEIF
jgi:predicted protein tyrosine phosphatase